MTKDDLRAAAPDLAGFVDSLRANGMDVTLKHVQLTDGRVLGKAPSLPPGCVELDWTERSLLEDWPAMTAKRSKR